MPSAVLSDFRILRPRFESSQERTLEWLSEAHRRAGAGPLVSKLIRRYACSTQAIARRGFEVEDYAHERWEEMPLLQAGFGARSEFFQRTVDGIFERFYREDEVPPQDLLHVTCTGYVSPSGAQKLLINKGWEDLARVTHLYHMGCYASFPAVRTASAYLNGEASARRVDIVHTELCTLHLDPTLHDPEQLVVQSLFADGYVRYSATPFERGATGLEVLALHETLIPGSFSDMTWACGDHRLQMTLSREVPEKIGSKLLPFLDDLLRRAGCSLEVSRREAVFAIHPGGPKIIDHLAQLLKLSEEQVRSSRETLRSFGNMSSATLPHVWKSVLEDAGIAPGTKIVSLAFGPGLTICGGVFRKVAS